MEKHKKAIKRYVMELGERGILDEMVQEEAAEMGQTGRTVLQFLVSASGVVVDARIASSSGIASKGQ